ncbi:sugar phosphate isomerase/epimerase [Enterococcus sp. PF1-24]|uniref:sugar phosphate isomerase/epimerase family protein n=1 Tax=unclassified Enterococcus TaxID=2608891 RepID=UPI0024767C8A|nr:MULTISPECIES: TIM barrel protein [unclassified Enterococcus]MDH6363992.1 sugar phosphate isomerase/epimerase [Enterococcus sp. PFB1-1]MDH6401093.1 sugar phosphate isomerase/epimerase [Enterococcus sp. PF1-24]
MDNFIVTGFADEISPDFENQVSVLKKNGISHIEIRGIDGKNVSDFSIEEAQLYKQKFDDAGIKVSSIGSPIGKINIEEAFSEHLEKFKHVLAIAEIFNSPYIRMFSFFIDEGKNADDFKEEVLNRWRQFLAVAKDYPKITLLHENEKDIYGDLPERCFTLIEELANPQLKVAFDPANFVQCDVEVYPRAYNLLKDQIAYMHIKDAKFSDHKVTPAGMGDGQVQRVLEELVSQDFRGFVSLEPHLSIFDGFAELEKENVSISAEASDGEKLFTVASDALKTILVDGMKQEWK